MSAPRRANRGSRPIPANRVLARLPVALGAKLAGQCKLVDLRFGAALHRPGQRIRYVYFPLDCLVALLTPIDGHPDRESGLVGHEGVVGIMLVLGRRDSPVSALVQIGGQALRLGAGAFLAEHARRGAFARELDRYLVGLTVQVAQTAGCNISHPVEQRLARWLLMTRDRVGSDSFTLTHAMLGERLGVLRGAITLAAGSLQRRKLVRYRRGEIDILDGARLEEAACRCYQVVKLPARKARASKVSRPD